MKHLNINNYKKFRSKNEFLILNLQNPKKCICLYLLQFKFVLGFKFWSLNFTISYTENETWHRAKLHEKLRNFLR